MNLLRTYAARTLAGIAGAEPPPIMMTGEGLRLGSATVSVVETDGACFGHARAEDQARWVASFRQLLDGLRRPVRLVVTSRRAQMDEHDSHPSRAFYARWLAGNPTYIRRVFAMVEGTVESSLLDALRHSGVRARVLTPLEVAALLLDSGQLAAAGESQMTAAAKTEHATTLQLEGAWMAAAHLARFPGAELEAGWLADLTGQMLEYDLAIQLEPESSASMIRTLTRQLRAMHSTRVLEAERDAVSDVWVEESLPDVHELRGRLARGEEKMFRASLHVAARGATHAEAEDGLRRLVVAADERMASLRPLRWRQATGTRAAGVIPGEVPGIRHLVPSSAVATLYPWTTADLWQRRGLHFGLNRVTGGLVAFDPFDQARFPNANIGILAQSGGGKTYLASILVSEARQRGAQVMVVDPEGEYRRLCASLDGQYVELGPGGPKSLNVLDRLSAGGEIEAALWDALDMIACICGHLDPGERAEMEVALRRLAAPKRAPTLSDLVREASRQTGLDRAVRLMRRWTEGALGEIFDRQSNVDPTCGFTVFGVRDLKDDLLPPAYALITSWLWHVVVNDPRPRLLLVDELGALFESPAARRFAVRVARRIRKYGGGFVFCTQNGRDILSGDEGRVIANNSAILFLGGQRGLEAAALEEAFELTPAQRRTLETANRGDFLLVAGEHRFPMRVMAADWQAPLIGGLAS